VERSEGNAEAAVRAQQRAGLLQPPANPGGLSSSRHIGRHQATQFKAHQVERFDQA